MLAHRPTERRRPPMHARERAGRAAAQLEASVTALGSRRRVARVRGSLGRWRSEAPPTAPTLLTGETSDQALGTGPAALGSAADPGASVIPRRTLLSAPAGPREPLPSRPDEPAAPLARPSVAPAEAEPDPLLVPVSDELVAAEVLRTTLVGGRDVVPVVDHQGRVRGVLSRAAIVRLGPVDRTNTLVSELVDRNPALRASVGADATELQRRPAVARAGLGVIVDRHGYFVSAVRPAPTVAPAVAREQQASASPPSAPETVPGHQLRSVLP